MENNYNQNSIKQLKGADQVRKRPAVIFGTNDEYGAAHGIFEIIANAVDEAREGYCDTINVNIWKDGTVEVDDNGRGVPMGWNEEAQEYNWKLVFCTLYASGKYDNSSYTQSGGLNGLGATAMQYASEFMDVVSYDGQKRYEMHFKSGEPVGKLKVTDSEEKGKTGTSIKFKPDSEVFINIKNSALPPTYYVSLLIRQAMLCAGLKIVFWHEEIDKKIVLYYENGISDFVKETCTSPLNKNVIKYEAEEYGTDVEGTDDYKLKMRCAFMFSREISYIDMYHNGLNLSDGGVTYDAVGKAFTKAFLMYGFNNGKISKNDRLKFRDVESILVFIGETTAPGHRTFFKNQTKTAINNPFIGKAYEDFIYSSLMNWLTNNKSEADKVLNEVLVNKQAREEADKVTKKVVQSLSKTVSFGNKPKKFVDCKTKNVLKRELYIVEGDSALGSVKMSRDASFQAILPVRGKIMNCLKKEIPTILSSDIIIDLLKVLGCGIEAKSKFIDSLPKFDIDKLNWGKIIICTDADVDGMQIRCLIITMIYRLCPSLLKAGKVFIAETPLYEMTYGKTTRFAYTDEERDSILNEFKEAGINTSKVKIQRSKGLGENDPDMMAVSTMNPDTRRLIEVEYPDADDEDNLVAGFFNALLGDDIAMRRVLISDYFDMTRADIE